MLLAINVYKYIYEILRPFYVIQNDSPSRISFVDGDSLKTIAFKRLTFHPNPKLRASFMQSASIICHILNLNFNPEDVV